MSIFNWGQELFARRCTPNARTSHFYWKLADQCRRASRFDFLEAILTSSLDFRLGEFGRALNEICVWGSERALRLLLQHETARSLGVEHYQNGFNQAARKNNPRFVLSFLEHHPDPKTCIVEHEAVIIAAGNGHMDVLPIFVERMKPTDMSQRTINQSLQAAGSAGHKCVVKYLTAIGADVDSIEEEICPASDSYKRFPLIINSNNRGGPRGVTALQAALIGFERFEHNGFFGLHQYLGSWRKGNRSSQEETIEVLIARGANAGLAADNELHTLHLAASFCSPVVVETLLLSGANTTDSLQPYDDALRAAASRERDSATIISIDWISAHHVVH